MVVFEPMITGHDLKKSFGGKLVLSGVSFVIPDGETVGLYGPSGIGKSTLAKLLCGVMRPDEGCISLDGELLVSSSLPYDRKRGLAIQMVYQQPYSSLDPSQKLIQGFRELIRYHHFAQDRSEEERLLQGLMQDVGLDMGILQHLPRQISGGEAQRVAIARCLLFHPKLLILDEATSMLDVSTQANVLALVRGLMAKSKGSILLISHDRALVDTLCNQIYVFDNKTLKETKTT
ncbi:MAG: ABC transporter ATP-binding protein [Oscillospiraceae bacterium]|nr:ABC transporter ATP-binding protein [Oscillospiraceae bacterium]